MENDGIPVNHFPEISEREANLESDQEVSDGFEGGEEEMTEPKDDEEIDAEDDEESSKLLLNKRHSILSPIKAQNEWNAG